jgi:hypothetical protein
VRTGDRPARDPVREERRVPKVTRQRLVDEWRVYLARSVAVCSYPVFALSFFVEGLAVPLLSRPGRGLSLTAELGVRVAGAVVRWPLPALVLWSYVMLTEDDKRIVKRNRAFRLAAAGFLLLFIGWCVFSPGPWRP